MPQNKFGLEGPYTNEKRRQEFRQRLIIIAHVAAFLAGCYVAYLIFGV